MKSVTVDYNFTVKIIEQWFVIMTKIDGRLVKRPFILRDYQKRTLREMFDNPKNVLIEKTRQMGLSWLFAAYFTVLLLFGRNEHLLVIGKKENFVDSAKLNIETLMGRIKFILLNLRDENMRKLINHKVNINGRYTTMIESQHLFITNNIFGNICQGESSSGSSGRGGTFTQVWWDETAFTRDSEAIFASVAPNSERLFMISTAHGKNNIFYAIKNRIDKKELKKTWHKVRVHWSEYFDDDWYEIQKEDLGNDPTLIAQELDIDYESSSNEKIFYNFDLSNFRDDLIFNRRLAGNTVITFDFGIRDYTAGAVIQHNPTNGEFYIVDSFQVYNIPFKDILDLITQPNQDKVEALKHKTNLVMWNSLYRFYVNSLKYGYSKLQMTGDPSATARSLADGHSIADLFWEYGLPFETYRERNETVLSGIRGNQNKIYIASHLEEVRNCIFNWSYSVDKDGQPLKAKHDEYSHIGTGLGYGFNYFFKGEYGGLRYSENSNLYSDDLY